MNLPVRVRLHLLGRLELSFDEESTPVRVTNRKARALLAYLAMAPGQAARREELATLLWGDCSDQQARQSLRQSLLLLRKDLRGADFVLSNSEMVQLAKDRWSVDAAEFAELTRSALPEDLKRAATLFAGDFAAGFHTEEEGFDEWISAQRLRVQRAATRLCETFAQRPDLVADPEAALGVSEHLLALDPLREDWQRLVLIIHARYRGKGEALSLGEHFSQILHRELGQGPEPATLNLLARIRAEELTPINWSPSRQPSRGVSSTAPDPVPSVPGSNPFSNRAPAPAPRRHPPARQALILLSVLAVLAALGFATLHQSQERLPAASMADRSTPPAPNQIEYWKPPSAVAKGEWASGVIPIVILPFSALSQDGGSPSGERATSVADMLTDDLTNILSRNKMFRVISRQTARKFQDRPLDVDAMRAQLHVRYILEGSVRVLGDRLRVNVELVDASNKAAVWSERIERDGTDRYSLQDEIVARLARELHLEVLPLESARLRNDPDADALVHRGWAAMNMAFAKTDTHQFAKAETLFKQALERDPQNLSAMIGLGAYHANVGAQVLDTNSKAHLETAQQILTEVLTRSPNNGVAPFYLGLVHGASGRLEEALAAFKLAVENNPSHAGAHAHIGHALARMERAAEGLEHLHYALRLSPRDPNLAYWYEFIGSAEMALGQYREAIAHFSKSAALNPGYPRSWAGLSAASALAGDLEAARKHAGKLREFAPGADNEALIRRFGRNEKQSPKLHEGLRLALAPVADSWQSPRLPSHTDAAPPVQASEVTAIAVMPFTTHGDTQAQAQHAAEAVTNDLTNVLSRVPALRVISRQTMQHYAGQKADVAAIGAELGVRYLLEGNMRIHGDKLRVNVELTDPSTRQSLWTLRLDRDPGNLYGLQDEIVGRLGRELHYEIYKIESERASDNPSIRQLAFRGWNLLINHADFGLDHLDRAKEIFDQILAQEPANLTAQHGLGWYHGLAGTLRLDAHSAAHLEKAEAILAEIVRSLPNNSAAHFMTGLLQRTRGRLEDALVSYQRALEINPSFASAYAHIGHTLIQLGRPSEGINQIRYALRLSPRDAARSHWLRFLGEGEAEAGDPRSAVETLGRSYAINPKQPLTLRAFAATHALLGNTDEVRRLLSEIKAAAPHMTGEQLAHGSARGFKMMPEMAKGWRLALASAS
jgi:TolB-like protein/DNA-binding SARP family transcriptional activator/Tfp pilus assembly protein PilF